MNVEKKRSDAKSPVLRALGCLVLLGAGLTTLLLVAAWLLRDVIVTQAVEAALRERGVVCDGISIQSTPFMGELTLAPTSCALPEGTITQVTWREPVVLTRSGLGISAVRATQLEVTRVARPTDAQAAAWGALGEILHGPEQVGAVLVFAARMSRSGPTPSLDVGLLHVRAPGVDAPELTLADLHVAERSEGPVDAHVQSISLAPMGSSLGLLVRSSVSDVTLHAEPTRGVLAGELEAGSSIPALGGLSLRHVRRVEVTGEELDQATPRWSLR